MCKLEKVVFSGEAPCEPGPDADGAPNTVVTATISYDMQARAAAAAEAYELQADIPNIVRQMVIHPGV